MISTNSVKVAVWTAAAVIAFNEYNKVDGNVYVRQVDIQQLASDYCTNSVANARVSQWFNGDHSNNTYNFLRGKGSLRRITKIGEFDGVKEFPEELSQVYDETVLTESKGEITIRDLFNWIRDIYSNDINEKQLVEEDTVIDVLKGPVIDREYIEGMKEHTHLSWEGLLSPKSKETIEISTIDFLTKGLDDIVFEVYDDKELLVRNYIYVIELIRKDLKSIEEELDKILKRRKELSDDDQYKRRKCDYFERINRTAKNEIVEFLIDGINDFIREHKSDLINRTSNEDKAFDLHLRSRYEYAFMSRFYNLDYDYSLDVKFRNLSKEPLIEMEKRIEKYAKIKSRGQNNYKDALKIIINKKKLVQEIKDMVHLNFYLNKRTELFETLLELYDANKYQSFVNLATIQLEGLFYDLSVIRYGKTSNVGTLVEKVEKSFNQDSLEWKVLYPYFAFEIPDIRNEIAHNGILDVEDIELIAYELILDISNIIMHIKRESEQKFTNFLMIADELDSVEDPDDPEYPIRVCEKLIFVFISCYNVCHQSFWKVLKKPNDFKDEIEFYCSIIDKEFGEYYEKVILGISNIVKDDLFWKVLLDTVQDGGGNDFSRKPIDFLTKDYIGILEGETKQYCINVMKKISVKKD